jgi:ankyrin repeat protein
VDGISRRQEAVVKLLLGTGMVDINSKGLYERTLLSWASRRGYEAIVKLLLQMGKINVDSEDCINRLTPLLLAAREGYKNVVQLL